MDRLSVLREIENPEILAWSGEDEENSRRTSAVLLKYESSGAILI